MALTKREIIATSADGLTMCTSEVEGKPHKLTLEEPLRAADTNANEFLLSDDHVRAIVEYAAAVKLGYNRRKPGAKKAKKAKTDGGAVAAGASELRA